MDGQQHERAMVYPVASDRSWFDPPLILRNLYTQLSVVAADASVSKLAAPSNPMRWAIGFTVGPNSAGSPTVAPFPDTIGDSGIQVPSRELVWFYLPKHGPLCMGPWFIAPGTGPTVNVIEVIRLAGGSFNAVRPGGGEGAGDSGPSDIASDIVGGGSPDS